MNAEHFRERAARAREMAQFGDDLRIAQMLLDVARDMDAEADAIESGQPNEQRRSPRFCPSEAYRALLRQVSDDATGRPVQVINLSLGGAKLRCTRAHAPGTRVVLEIPCRSVQLPGKITRMRGIEAAMVFKSEAASDLNLRRLVRELTLSAAAVPEHTGAQH